MSTDVAKQRILHRVPLSELIGEKVSLKQKGGRYSGCCPFHDDSSPSFYIFDDHYYCFGCHAKGDAITFVREQQGLSFMEALRYLAQKYGIEAPELDNPSQDRAQRQSEANLYKICAAAQKIFTDRLQSSAGEKARHYLEQRGFSAEFIQKHQFGLSPSDPQQLVNQLLRQGFSVPDLITSSVANASQYDHRAYDFFTQRLMIPIYDLYGRVVAFGGRSLGDEQPKYKNSRETPLFDKSHILYGLHSARDSIRKERRAIVCEGYMDVLQLWQGGIPYAVACLGTALTVHHLRRLASLTPRVYLIFDGDRAGRAATLRTVSLALEVPQTEFKVVILPPEHDPDTFIRAHGAKALEDLLDQAQNLLEFAIQARVSETHELGIPDLISKEFVPWLLTIPDTIKRTYLANKIAELTGVESIQIEQTVKHERIESQRKAKETPAAAPQAAASPAPRAPMRPLKGPELEFIGHLYWSRPDEIELDKVEEMLKSQLELDELWQDFALEMLKALRKNLAPSEQNKAVWTASTAPETLQLLEQLETHAPAFETAVRQVQMGKLAHEIRRQALRDALARLKQTMLRAKPEEQTEILAAVAKISRELNQRAAPST